MSNPHDHDDDKDGILIGPPLELKYLDNAEAGTFSGYAATFNGVDMVGDRIAPGSFRDSIKRHKAAGTLPALLWNHDPGQPVGSLISIQEDGSGLQISGRLNLKTGAGVKAREHMVANEANGLSIGFQVARDGAEILKGGLRVLKKLHLHEISIVTMPADSRARVMSVKSAFNSRSELEEILTKHLPRGAARKLLDGGWPAIIGAVDEPDPAIAAAELAEKSAIARLIKRVESATLELKKIG